MPARTFAFYHLKDLQPGRVLDLISDEEPTPLMHSVSALMRQRIDWEILEQGPPLWRLKVRRRENVAAGSLAGLLMRDHERLDRLLAHTLQKVNAGEGRAARAPYELFALGVRRHIHAENDVLAPELVEIDEPGAKQSLVTMLTEHEQILQQLDVLDGYFSGSSPQAAEVAPWVGLLSGSMAQHEAREEDDVFPLWRALLHVATAQRQQELLEVVERILNGSDDLVTRALR